MIISWKTGNIFIKSLARLQDSFINQYSFPSFRLRNITSYSNISIISETSSKRIVFLDSLFVMFCAVVVLSGCLAFISFTIFFNVVHSAVITVFILVRLSILVNAPFLKNLSLYIIYFYRRFVNSENNYIDIFATCKLYK